MFFVLSILKMGDARWPGPEKLPGLRCIFGKFAIIIRTLWQAKLAGFVQEKLLGKAAFLFAGEVPQSLSYQQCKQLLHVILPAIKRPLLVFWSEIQYAESRN